MKKVVDKFSEQSAVYKKYRPTYPKELYEQIIRFVNRRDKCLDCGTGNGQAAIELSAFFDKVYATDVSRNQIVNSERKDNIFYCVGRAERACFKENQFDLITVGQAYHWFDLDEFNKEAKRVSKNGGIICVWGYGLIRITPKIDELIDIFYNDTVGAYWDMEREYVDNKYETIKFDFPEISVSNNLSIFSEWSLMELAGYFNSWSSIQNYKNKNSGENPVDEVIQRISEQWNDDSKMEVNFPIFKRIGRIDK